MTADRDPAVEASIATRLLQSGALEQLARAVEAIESDEALRDDVEFTRDELLAELELLALLQADAQRVIDGDQLAARRFELLLEGVAAKTVRDADLGQTALHLDSTIQSSEEIVGTDIVEDDTFVRLDELMAVGVAAGMLAAEPGRFDFLFSGLTNLVGALYELNELHEAALLFLRHGDTQPMRMLAWHGPAPRPKSKRKSKPKPKPKPKPKRRPWFKAKIKDTHSAWMSCFRNAALRAHAESMAAPRFTVISVTPIDACPGQQIVIRGTNFGSVGGAVAFRAASTSADEYAAVSADVWTDTAITVTVPGWAREGRLHISPLDHAFVECHRKWAVNRLPDPAGPQNDTFLGGLPDIFKLQVNGRDWGAWAPPGLNATISWVATSGAVSIDVRNDADASEAHWQKAALPGGTGSTAWPAKAVTAPTKFIVAMTITNRCGSVTKELPVIVTVPAVLKIEGIEVTQGVQKFTLVGSGPRNALATVEHKDTIARVYVSSNRSWWFNNLLSNVTAVLTIAGQPFQPINKAPAGKMTGGNPYLNLGHLLSINRESADSSFNFRIPAALCIGTQTFKVEVWGIDEFGALITTTQWMTWTWQKKNALRMRYVRVLYRGIRPSPADALFTLQRAFDLLPTPALDLGPAWQDQWDTGQDLSTSDGKQKLLDHLLDLHNCTFSEWALPWEDDCPDNDGALWIGVVPGNVGGRGRAGGNTAWAASAVTGDRISAAHETGHMLCLCHVNQGCDGSNPDPSNICGFGPKQYDSLSAMGLVLDVAFDPYYNTVVPMLRYDFMSYACNRWISETNWNRLSLLF